MIPLQELEFRLKSKEIIFSHIVSIGDGGFAAQVTNPFPSNQIPTEKFYRWLPCPSGSDARMAFKEIANAILNYASKTSDNAIASVNNPCNCEFVPAAFQRDVVGPQVEVLVNGARTGA